jgi:dihydrofolate reductase/thymidylate synthase
MTNITMKTFDIIVAVDKTNGIGSHDVETNSFNIPWKIKGELEYFRTKTTLTELPGRKNAVIMGRNTWNSIPKKYRPLPNRVNIVLTSDTTQTDEYYRATSLDEALNIANNLQEVENVFVIGGKKLYEESLTHKMLRFVFVTKIDDDFKCNINLNMNPMHLIELDSISSNLLNESTGNLVSTTFYKYQHVNNLHTSTRHPEYQYLDLLRKIMYKGNERPTRNAITKSLFGYHIVFDLRPIDKSLSDDGWCVFPQITTRSMGIKGAIEELKLFMSGSSDSKILEKKNINFWKGNTTREFLDSVGLEHLEEGDLGMLYPIQWRAFGVQKYEGKAVNHVGKGFDQLQYVIDTLKKDPYSRRIIMISYNPAQMKECPIFPCHSIVIQFYLDNDQTLSIHMYQRSADLVVGKPTNFQTTTLLLLTIINIINNSSDYTGPKFRPGDALFSGGDAHIYEQHYDVVKEQLTRKPFPFPKIKIMKNITSLDEINNIDFKDIVYKDKQSHPALKAEMVA